MTNQALHDAFAPLSTPLVADASLRLRVLLRPAPAGIGSIPPAAHVAGRALPARHSGSVDVFLEALEESRPGDILVIDDGDRRDQACVGDLLALECRAAGLGGMVVWGLHRDTRDLHQIGLPVFSYGAFGPGPRGAGEREPEALASARFGDWTVGRDDVVFADEDGVLFVPAGRAQEVLATARGIHDKERRQAEEIRSGTRLREQLRFADYLRRRAEDPAHSFRAHLRSLGAEIEE